MLNLCITIAMMEMASQCGKKWLHSDHKWHLDSTLYALDNGDRYSQWSTNRNVTVPAIRYSFHIGQPKIKPPCSLPNQVYFVFSVNVSPSTLDKPVSKSETLVGSCTAWNTVSSRMDRCQVTRLSVVVMTHSIHSSLKPVQANTYPVLSLLIWNQP